MAVSITPVVVGAAINGPPPPAPSMYRKAICLPSCDQRGRAAYPTRPVLIAAREPSALAIQSCRWSRGMPAVEKNASHFESGDQAGSKSVPRAAPATDTSVGGLRCTFVGVRLPEVAIT